MVASNPGNAQEVASAFLGMYFRILHAHPDHVCKFYKNESVVTQTDTNGVKISATTTDGINNMILSFGYENYNTEIKSVDYEESYNGSVMILITACRTGKDHTKKKFAELFLLAPQEKGYYVLNDVIRYVDENQSVALQRTPASDNVAVGSVPSRNKPADPEFTRLSGATGVPKKSYASVVKAANGHMHPHGITSNTEQCQVKSAVLTPEPEAWTPSSNNATVTSDSPDEGKEIEECKKLELFQPDSVQVRSDCKPEIMSVDSQVSYNGSVTISVTGCRTDENQELALQSTSATDDGAVESGKASNKPSEPVPDPTQVSGATGVPKRSYASVVKAMNGHRHPKAITSDIEQYQVESEVPAPRPEAWTPSSNNATAISDSHDEDVNQSLALEGKLETDNGAVGSVNSCNRPAEPEPTHVSGATGVPKRSYASVVKAMNWHRYSRKVTEQRRAKSVVLAPGPEAWKPSWNSATVTSYSHDEVKEGEESKKLGLFQPVDVQVGTDEYHSSSDDLAESEDTVVEWISKKYKKKKVFVCNACRDGKSFVKIKGLQEHREAKHGDMLEFQCLRKTKIKGLKVECGDIFHSREELEEHKRQPHPPKKG